MTTTPYGCGKCGIALTFAEAPNHHHACMGAKCSRCEAWFNDEHDRGVCDECRAEIGPQTDHHLDSPAPAIHYGADDLMPTEKVLPADVYDALELSALAYGGIGANRTAERGETLDTVASGADAPYCVLGHAAALDGEGIFASDICKTLARVGIYAGTNDRAVATINLRNGVVINARVPFADWCAELGVVRGES